MPSKMIRSKLYRLAAERANMPASEVAKAVDAFLEEVKDALRDGKRVELRRFGSFWPSPWRGRVVVPPKQAEGLSVPRSRTVHFYAGEDLRAMRG
jgi:nucleoid DNA-binding protein